MPCQKPCKNLIYFSSSHTNRATWCHSIPDGILGTIAKWADYAYLLWASFSHGHGCQEKHSFVLLYISDLIKLQTHAFLCPKDDRFHIYFLLFCFSGMGRCDQCVPCYRKKCWLCSNCIPNEEGKRSHRKCRRQICMRDRKSIFPSPITDFSKGSQLLEEIAKHVLKSKKQLKHVKKCTNVQKYANKIMKVLQNNDACQAGES